MGRVKAEKNLASEIGSFLCFCFVIMFRHPNIPVQNTKSLAGIFNSWIAMNGISIGNMCGDKCPMVNHGVFSGNMMSENASGCYNREIIYV